MEPMQNLGRRLGLVQLAATDQLRARARIDRGEGVISMAIAVLIIAAIGVIMWQIFLRVANDTGGRMEDQVNQIGN